MTVEIVCADAREALAAMPEGSVHTCVTSPPYWGLRDYGLELTVWGDADCKHEWGEELPGDPRGGSGPDAKEKDTYARQVARGAFCRRCNAWRGTLGLEPTPELYVEHIVQVMREVRRVLRDDGTLWLNLGDSYAGSGRGMESSGAQGRAGEKQQTNPGSLLDFHDKMVGAGAIGRFWVKPPPGLKPKDLCGMPWRVAFALQSDGWWLRSDIVWSKPNPMPESVRDRPTRAHEYVFLLSKSQRYFYDADAIREPVQSGPSDVRKMLESKERIGGKNKDATDPLLKASSKTNIGRKRAVGGTPLSHKGSHFDRGKTGGHQLGRASEAPRNDNGLGRNKRSVWEIATQPYPEAHFAVFPEKLVEPCILAGTSERGCCPECGAPWERLGSLPASMLGEAVRFLREKAGLSREELAKACGKGANNVWDWEVGSHIPTGQNWERLAAVLSIPYSRADFVAQAEYIVTGSQDGPKRQTGTIDGLVKRPYKERKLRLPREDHGWRPTCDHEGEPMPCVALDPFAGSGTVGVVAERLGRHSVLIDAKEEYCAMARHRTAQRGLMVEVPP